MNEFTIMIKLGKDVNVNLKKTAKKVMETEFPGLWQQATATVEQLVELQEKLIEELKTSKNLLPQSFEELKEEEAQLRLMDYIRLRSLFAFAEGLSKLIDEQCRDVVERNIEKDRDATDTAKRALKNTLEKASTFPYDEVGADRVNGFFRLNQLKESFKDRMDFLVFKIMDGKVARTWSFRDIAGTIVNQGLSQSLWEDAVEDDVPVNTTIEGLLSDNEIIRTN